MIRVGIEEIKPGMILKNPVKNNQGVLLLEAGAKISKKNIRIFKSWGVTSVAVKGGGDPGQRQRRAAATPDKRIRRDALKREICGCAG